MIINKELRWVSEAILKLDSTCMTSIAVTENGCEIELVEGTLPAEADIIAKADELKLEFDNNQYSRDRVQAYPSIGDQLDMLWHAIDAGTLDTTSDFYTTLAAVKDDNPKPE